MSSIVFGNFHEIWQSFDMRLGFHIDTQNLIWQSKFQIDNQSFMLTLKFWRRRH